MSYLVKAAASPQSEWYYKWTSLGSDGLSDHTIKVRLKQPNHIKISFIANSKEYSASVASNQAHFGPEFFLAKILPDFKHQVVNCLTVNKKKDGPTLFPLWNKASKKLHSLSGAML